MSGGEHLGKWRECRRRLRPWCADPPWAEQQHQRPGSFWLCPLLQVLTTAQEQLGTGMWTGWQWGKNAKERLRWGDGLGKNANAWVYMCVLDSFALALCSLFNLLSFLWNVKTNCSHWDFKRWIRGPTKDGLVQSFLLAQWYWPTVVNARSSPPCYILITWAWTSKKSFFCRLKTMACRYWRNYHKLSQVWGVSRHGASINLRNLPPWKEDVRLGWIMVKTLRLSIADVTEKLKWMSSS